MKSAGYYFMRGGRQVWAATVAEIRKLAQLAADELGKPVKVQRAARSKAAPMKRNPAPPSPRPPAAMLTTYNEGRSAWRRGWGIDFNPYQSADLRKMWVKGWRAARDKGQARQAREAGTITARRNPAIRGVDFTGEEWTVAGLGKRGRLAVTEGSRQDAERMADQLHNEGYRALTIRRTAAPVSKPERGARRPTIDVRPIARKGRRA